MNDMKRIIALILVIVLAMATLVGCAYSYASDDLTKYSTFDKDAFVTKLATLEILDGDFTTDEDTRKDKVIDAIYQSLATNLENADKIKEGTPKKYDLLYYCYYCTFTVEGVEYTVLASNMKEEGAIKLQLGVADLKGYEKAISDAALAYDIKDKVYTTHTSGEVKNGDVAYVTYTVEYSVTGDDGQKTTKKETVSNKEYVITEGDDFSAQLVGKNIGTELQFTVGTGDDAKTYSAVKVQWVVDKAVKLGEYKNVTYTAKQSVKDVNGKEHDLKDVELTYHVYPVYFNAMTEYNADSVLNVLLGADITPSILDVFEDENYKYTADDGTTTSLKDLVTKLAELQAALDNAKKDRDTKKTTYDTKKATADAEGATAAQKTEAEKAKTDLDAAETALTEAQTAVDSQIEKIYATGSDVKDKIVEDYKKQAYEALENSYNTEIKNNLAKKLYELILADVTVSSYPEKAVNETYDRLLENYEYNFYTGTYDSDQKISNYAQYNGSFDEFLKAKTNTETKAAALESIKKEATTYVEPIVKIYVVAKAFDVLVTDADFEQYKKDTATFEYYATNYGESNVRVAYQFDQLLDHFLKVSEDKVDEDGKITYVDGKLPFANISYTIVEEDASDDK